MKNISRRTTQTHAKMHKHWSFVAEQSFSLLSDFLHNQPLILLHEEAHKVMLEEVQRGMTQTFQVTFSTFSWYNSRIFAPLCVCLCLSVNKISNELLERFK